MWLDALSVKVREHNRVINEAVYLVLGVTLSGNKELLGLWVRFVGNLITVNSPYISYPVNNG